MYEICIYEWKTLEIIIFINNYYALGVNPNLRTNIDFVFILREYLCK